MCSVYVCFTSSTCSGCVSLPGLAPISIASNCWRSHSACISCSSERRAAAAGDGSERSGGRDARVAAAAPVALAAAGSLLLASDVNWRADPADAPAGGAAAWSAVPRTGARCRPLQQKSPRRSATGIAAIAAVAVAGGGRAAPRPLSMSCRHMGVAEWLSALRCGWGWSERRGRGRVCGPPVVAVRSVGLHRKCRHHELIVSPCACLCARVSAVVVCTAVAAPRSVCRRCAPPALSRRRGPLLPPLRRTVTHTAAATAIRPHAGEHTDGATRRNTLHAHFPRAQRRSTRDPNENERAFSALGCWRFGHRLVGSV